MPTKRLFLERVDTRRCASKDIESRVDLVRVVRLWGLMLIYN